jgi:hypothetical protein
MRNSRAVAMVASLAAILTVGSAALSSCTNYGYVPPPPPQFSFNVDRPFSASSPWNTPTPAATTWYDTPVLHQASDGSVRHWWVGNEWSIQYAGDNDTDVTWTFKMPAYVAADWNRDRPATTFTMQGPPTLAASTDADHQLALVDPETANYVEVGQATVDSTNHIVRSTGPGWARGNAATGAGAGTVANNDGVRASNFSIEGGMLTEDEITGSAPIDHALEIGLPFDMLKGGWPSPGVNYVAPATADDSGGWAGPIMMGSRIGVPADVAMPAGLSPLGVKVFNALQEYGMFVGDYVGGTTPVIPADGGTVHVNNDACSLFCYWNYGGSSDMEKIGPLLRVADYQP